MPVRIFRSTYFSYIGVHDRFNRRVIAVHAVFWASIHDRSTAEKENAAAIFSNKTALPHRHAVATRASSARGYVWASIAPTGI